MAIQIQLRRDTAANWTAQNPVLAEGEPGVETDTLYMKVGNGTTAWVSLAYLVDAANPFDQDLNTSDAVSFTGLTSNGLTYPSADGTAGQSIVTDGAGTLSFAAGANPFDQDLNTTDAVIFDKVTLTGPLIERQVAATFASGTLTLNCDDANIFTHDLTANITTLTIDNIPLSGSAIGLTLVFTMDGTARTVAWPASFYWPSGTAPTLTSTVDKKDVFVCMTYDAGTTWMAFVAGQNL